jgi:hypothetical protein
MRLVHNLCLINVFYLDQVPLIKYVFLMNYSNILNYSFITL